MNKRDLYTAIGIALSLLIAIGGWWLTQGLLDKKEKALLAVTGSIQVNSPIIVPAETNKTPDEENAIGTGHDLPQLTDSEIVSVLNNWEAEGNVRPHEPVAGQLSMEQAMSVGEAGLDLFSDQGIVPVELLEKEYERISATLCINQPLDKTSQPLEPYYSYWTVTFHSEDINVIFTINAITGQIWRAMIFSFKPGINFNQLKMDNALSVFVSYMGLGGGASGGNSETEAFRGFAENTFYAVAKKTSVKIDNEEAAYSNLDILLTTQAPKINY